MKELKYTNGMAFILISEKEEASEYHSDSYYYVQVNFKTAVAIRRLTKELGTNMISEQNKKNLLEQKAKKPVVSIRLRFSGEDFPMGQSFWYLKTGYKFEYMNHYSDEHYELIIPVTKEALKTSLKDKYFKSIYENKVYGSCADSSSLKDFIDNKIKTKNVIR